MPSISATSSPSWTCSPRMWKSLTTFPTGSMARRSSTSITTSWWRAWPQRTSASGNHRAACMARRDHVHGQIGRGVPEFLRQSLPAQALERHVRRRRAASGGLEALAQAEAGAEDLLEVAAVLAGGFELELDLVGRDDLDADAVVADGAVDLLDARGVGAVEGVGDAQQDGEAADGLLLPGLERREGRVLALRQRAAVVAGEVGDDLDLGRIEAGEAGVGDQVVGVLVVVAVVDRVADVVQQRGVLEPLALAAAKAVQRGGDGEQAQREPRRLKGGAQHGGGPLGEPPHLAAAEPPRAAGR